MAITRTPWTDDDGTGTTGTILNNAEKTALYDQIDAAIDGADATVRTVAKGGTGAATLTPHGVVVGNGTSAVNVTGAGTAGHVLTSGGASADPTYQPNGFVCEGRLTLTSGTPVTMADVTGATTIFWTPFQGNRISLYGSSGWATITFAETSLALGTVTSGLLYDVFAYNNSGTLALEKLAWTNGTTRATALTTQDGVLVKSGDATRRFLGTFYTTSTTTTEDSLLKRFVWNYYNRQPRNLAYTTTGSHTYTTATWRSWNNDATARVEFIIGVAEQHLFGMVGMRAANSTGSVLLGTGFGIDSTTGVSGVGLLEGAFNSLQANIETSVPVLIPFTVAAGYHFLQLVEYSTATGTTTWNPNLSRVGLVSNILG
jgi:hypothetical protein